MSGWAWLPWVGWALTVAVWTWMAWRRPTASVGPQVHATPVASVSPQTYATPVATPSPTLEGTGPEATPSPPLEGPGPEAGWRCLIQDASGGTVSIRQLRGTVPLRIPRAHGHQPVAWYGLVRVDGQTAIYRPE